MAPFHHGPNNSAMECADGREKPQKVYRDGLTSGSSAVTLHASKTVPRENCVAKKLIWKHSEAFMHSLMYLRHMVLPDGWDSPLYLCCSYSCRGNGASRQVKSPVHLPLCFSFHMSTPPWAWRHDFLFPFPLWFTPRECIIAPYHTSNHTPCHCCYHCFSPLWLRSPQLLSSLKGNCNSQYKHIISIL